jgi:arginyl-tRNA synthetase
MENLGRSTLARYRELLRADSEFPDGGYKGEYIRDIARSIVDREGGRFLEMPDEETVPFFTKEAADFILEGIKTDLERFRVKFDVWTSEKSFHDANMVELTVDRLRSSGAVFEEDGALWLNTVEAGDEKNRVIRRANGIFTYFAADIAYHEDKYRRGFTRLMDIWGADHHGYVARMKAAVKALGRDPDSLKPLLIQLVSLKRHGKVIAMSTRGGTFTTLKEVLDEVGEDAARFFFLTRSYDSHLDFDLDLAKEQSSENPVYYVQYAHARVSNIFVTARERGITEVPPREVDWSALEPAEEQRIIRKCLAFPGLVKDCAETLSPHHLTHYLVELAGMFHKYYYAHRVVTDDARLTSSRLALAARVRTVLGNGLDLLVVTAPDRM